MKRFALIPILLLLLLLPAGGAYASPMQDKVIAEDETWNGELTLFGEDLRVAAGGTVNGDVVLMGGNAVVEGTINGDLVLFGGDLAVGDDAVVTGDCALFGGELQGTEASGINCSRAGNFDFAFPQALSRLRPPVDVAPIPPAHLEPLRVQDEGLFLQLSKIAGRTVALSVIALIFAAIVPTHLNRVSRAISVRPVISGTVGVLTAAAGVSLITVLAALSGLLVLALCLGLLGIPVIFALVVVLVAALLFGWVAVGNLFGQRLVERLALKNGGPVVTAVLGTALVTLAVGFLSLLPFLLGGFTAGLAVIILAALGLGATTLTQFGTRPFPVTGTSGDRGRKIQNVLENLPDES